MIFNTVTDETSAVKKLKIWKVTMAEKVKKYWHKRKLEDKK